jgi:Iap family predicted aminopeptidase
MKQWILVISILVLFLIAFKANGQNIIQTYIDPCDNKVYTVIVPISSNQPGVLVLIRNKSRIFTYADFASGTVTKWVSEIFLTPCPVPIAATIAQQAAQAASSAASQAASTAASSAASSAASETSALTGNTVRS